MVERCRANVARDHSQAQIEIRQEDLRTTRIENASVVVMNFTLQFLPEGDRDNVLRGISDGLVDGGVFLLCEKIKFDNTEALVKGFINNIGLLKHTCDVE